MQIKNLKQIIIATKHAWEIVLCRRADTLMRVSLFLMSLPLAHTLGHRAWPGAELAAHPILADFLQVVLGYLMTLVVTGNTFLIYWLLRPVWRFIHYVLHVWHVCFISSKAAAFVASEFKHGE